MSTITTLFSGLDRLGPGNAESLRWALKLAGTRPAATVLDAGCGTGADLGVLLGAVPGGRVSGIDIEPAYVARARARHHKAVVSTGDMMALEASGLDLIWSAGAIHNVGVGRALDAWRGHLSAGGRVAFSDLRARVAAPPSEVSDFWRATGIPLTGAEVLEAEVAAAGYRVLGSRWLGTGGWASYYGPLEAAIDGFTGEAAQVTQLRAEIALWRTHGVNYGYRVLVCEPERNA